MKEQNSFLKGIIDGMPICLGYLSVAFAFGIFAVESGLSIWETLLISMTIGMDISVVETSCKGTPQRKEMSFVFNRGENTRKAEFLQGIYDKIDKENFK